MQQFNYPTTILFGEGAVAALAQRAGAAGLRRVLLVTDPTLVRLGLAERVTAALKTAGVESAVFDAVHPNPIEEDVERGVAAYREAACDGLVALGGGAPMDVAKVVKLMVAHEPPLARYDDALGGDRLVVHPMPPLYAIPTTAGTGSEVGRSGVIVMRESRAKTIFFHPRLMPDIAALEPALTAGLPPGITAATGMDAFTHCLESYLSPAFHPLADGVAFEGMRLVLQSLPVVVREGSNLEARGRMQVAAAMGATAFQKGLGMTHSLAHPLSAEYDMHHGLANAVLLPFCLTFLETSPMSEQDREKLRLVRRLFEDHGLPRGGLGDGLRAFVESLGLKTGLRNHGVPREDLGKLADLAFKDPCHRSNMVPVARDDLGRVYEEAW